MLFVITFIRSQDGNGMIQYYSIVYSEYSKLITIMCVVLYPHSKCLLSCAFLRS
jgi:hypothetical protein